jgi:hypothetical protein
VQGHKQVASYGTQLCVRFEHSFHNFITQGNQHFQVTKSEIWNIYIVQKMGNVNSCCQLPLQKVMAQNQMQLF